MSVLTQSGHHSLPYRHLADSTSSSNQPLLSNDRTNIDMSDTDSEWAELESLTGQYAENGAGIAPSTRVDQIKRNLHATLMIKTPLPRFIRDMRSNDQISTPPDTDRLCDEELVPRTAVNQEALDTWRQKWKHRSREGLHLFALGSTKTIPNRADDLPNGTSNSNPGREATAGQFLEPGYQESLATPPLRPPGSLSTSGPDLETLQTSVATTFVQVSANHRRRVDFVPVITDEFFLRGQWIARQ